MNYNHTQRAPLHYIPRTVAFACLGGAWLARNDWLAAVILCTIALTMFLLASMFTIMTVRDEGAALAIRYGPLPVFRHRIRYADITSVEPSRSALIDGWGIHWIPGRGTTFNLWGFACAKLIVRGRTVRIGSDDVTNLVAFVEQQDRGAVVSDVRSCSRSILVYGDLLTPLTLLSNGGENKGYLVAAVTSPPAIVARAWYSWWSMSLCTKATCPSPKQNTAPAEWWLPKLPFCR